MAGVRKAQFGFDKISWASLNALVKEYRLTSRAQAIRQAITLARFINKSIFEGWTVCLVKGDDKKEVLIAGMPFPEN